MSGGIGRRDEELELGEIEDVSSSNPPASLSATRILLGLLTRFPCGPSFGLLLLSLLLVIEQLLLLLIVTFITVMVVMNL